MEARQKLESNTSALWGLGVTSFFGGVPELRSPD